MQCDRQPFPPDWREPRTLSADELIVCDLTQSWSPSGGGGISTYLRRKADHVLANTPHR